MISDRVLSCVVGVLGAALVSVQVAVKPGFDSTDIRRIASAMGGNTSWRGRVAADFELMLRDGSTFRLKDHVGREVVVLNFFATWCGPCEMEMPELQRYANEMRDHHRPFVLVGVDAEERPDQVERFIRRMGLDFPVVIDADGRVQAHYGVEALPTTVVIGADGRIQMYETGALSNADVAFAAVVPKELAALTAGTGEERQRAYTAALERDAPTERQGWTPPNNASADDLRGRALAIAQAMPCPCGCDDTVVACTCHTANSIKARLHQGVDDNLSDGEVMQQLNREFCMKGM